MNEAPSTYDFALLTHATIELSAIAPMADELAADFHGSALRRRLREESWMRRTRKVNPSSIKGVERDRLGAQLKSFDVQPPVASTVAAAVLAFRERMGLTAPVGDIPPVQVRFESEEELL